MDALYMKYFFSILTKVTQTITNSLWKNLEL